MWGRSVPPPPKNTTVGREHIWPSPTIFCWNQSHCANLACDCLLFVQAHMMASTCVIKIGMRVNNCPNLCDQDKLTSKQLLRSNSAPIFAHISCTSQIRTYNKHVGISSSMNSSNRIAKAEDKCSDECGMVLKCEQSPHPRLSVSTGPLIGTYCHDYWSLMRANQVGS